jgi:amino acid adenylation domain-containing protein/non-ribosomal peptide synthase protein (TIGR01720 family)
MTIRELIKKLKENKIDLALDGNDLEINFDGDDLPDELIDEIRTYKSGIIQFLREIHGEPAEAIPALPQQESYVMSSAQRRMWLVSQFEEANIAYNNTGSFTFEGSINMEAFEKAFNTMVERHEVLRTVFREDGNGEVRQYVLPAAESGFALYYQDLRSGPNPEEDVKGVVLKSMLQPFDLAKGPLVRAEIYQVTDHKWIFCYIIHHIISDGWSGGIFTEELFLLYNVYKQGGQNPLPPLRIHYKDYAAWQQAQLTGEQLEMHRNYWLSQMEGELPLLDMPGDKARPAFKTYNGHTFSNDISVPNTKALRALTLSEGGTLFMGILAVVNVLLHRYTAQEDIIIGFPIAGRDHPDVGGQIGCYINTLTLRTRFKGTDTFRQLIKNIKQVTLNGYEHQIYPFDELVDNLGLQRDMSRNPVFDAVVVLHNATGGKDTDVVAAESNNEDVQQAWANHNDLSVSGYGGNENVISKYDLNFDFGEVGEAMFTRIEYNTDIFNSRTIQQMIRHEERIIVAAAANPDLPINQLDILSEEEKQQLLTGFNQTTTAYPKDKTIVALFEEQVAQYPDRTAVVFRNTSLTYRELNERADKLAHYLQTKHQVQPDDMVGIMLDLSENQLVAILGILKSGAAYVPIDADYPKARKELVVKDTAIKALITQTDYIFDLDYFSGDMIALDVQLEMMEAPTAPITSQAGPNSLAYVMYTSGSTGTPKGVMVEQHSVVRLVRDTNYVRISENDKVLSLSSYAFDGSVFDFFGALLNGATVYMPLKEQMLDFQVLAKLIEDNGITMFYLTTALFNSLVDAAFPTFSQLRYILFGGERVSLPHVRKFRANYPSVQLVHVYGPTENTTFSTFYHVGDLPDTVPTVPIGGAIANTQCYILNQSDPALPLPPLGVVGEIYVAGDGLARGYLNHAELTAEKFVDNPYAPGTKMYKTGDLGRWLPDGSIEFTGRKDDQVKVRGFRIELGEIETVLQQHPSVEAAVVVARPNPGGEKEIVAYIVGKEPLNITDMRAYLGVTLPAYMIPAHFVEMEALPLGSTGKVDKKALPNPMEAVMNTGAAYVAPRNENETVLIAVFEEVLKKNQISVLDDFFVLGGDSIKSIQIVSRLKQRGYTLSVQDVLMHPVVEDLASRMALAARLADQSTVEGMVPLLPVQRAFFESAYEHKHHFNQPIVLDSTISVSETHLRAALDKLMLHHDALRMVYRQTETDWVQENKGADMHCSLEVMDYGSDEQYLANCERMQASIDLANGPLFKAALYRRPEGDRLQLVAHHLIVDGISWRIITEDLATLYQQSLAEQPLTLPAKTDSFKHWAEKLGGYAQSNALQEEAAYWEGVESAGMQTLPVENETASNTMADLTNLTIGLDEQATDKLLTQCFKAYRTEVNDILIAALALGIADTFGIDRVVLMMEGHGREPIGGDEDITRTVGWFTSVYPVSINMQYKDDVVRQVIEVKETLHRVPNKGLGYGVLRYLANKPYQLHPQIAFNYLGDFGPGGGSADGQQVFGLSGAYQGQFTNPGMQRPYVLELNAMVVAGKLTITIGFSQQQYKAETMRKLEGAYVKYLTDLITKLSAEESTTLTPVDFAYQGLSMDDLDKLNKMLGNS